VCAELVARPALAHPKIEAARARLETAEFETALRLLAVAEAGSDLSRDEALRLLELRALVHLALKDREEAQAALRVLAVLAPDHAFAPQTSPDLIAQWKVVRASAPPAPQLAVEHTLRPDGVNLHAAVNGDELGIVRGVRFWTRVGTQPWRSTLAFDTAVLATPGARVEYRAVALGIGGAPLLETDVQALTIPAAQDDRNAAAVSPWLYAGVIGGAVAALSVGALLLLSGDDQSDSTRVSPPMLVQP
jgi:hypothetical protein